MRLHPLWALTSLGLAGLLGCGSLSDSQPEESTSQTTLSFAEFEALVHREPATGIYIVDGDIPITTREELHRFWEQHVQSGALIINTVGGNDDRWGPDAQQNLSYCVSTAFGGNHGLVVQAMAQAAADWEAAANIRFVYRADQDGACNAANANVVFDVNPATGGWFWARAFFPNEPRALRNLLIDTVAFGNIAPITLAGLLRHELGHTLGFRHEHIRRPDAAGNCAEATNWRQVTPYDSDSVMHYPWCGGTNQGDLVLTQRDREGVAAIYGARPTICSQRTPLYQTHNPNLTDYFYTISPSERDISIIYHGYSNQGIAAALESVQVAGTLPFQRFYKGPPQREHFYTSSDAEASFVLANGWVYERVEGYLYTSQQPGTIPFYRLNRWEPSTSDLQHFYTIHAWERDSLIQQGWGYDGIAGYVCPW